MGYGLAVMAEMICEAMLGPVAVEANTLMITMDTHRLPRATYISGGGGRNF